MKVKEFNEKKIYSDGNGIVALVDPHIKMHLNDYGIYEEIIDVSDDHLLDPRVEKVSTYLNEDTDESQIGEKLYSNVDGIKFDQRIGYYKSSFIGHVLEDSFRENGSSGGTGTWILKELLEKDLIDGVIHVKKNTDLDSPILFKYDISETIEEIKNGAKTKYYPVELSEVLSFVKENPKRYALVGIPSFIYGVRLLQEIDPVFKKSIVYTVGLVCGHQKSAKFAESLAWSQGIKPGDLLDINFRKKLKDGPANAYAVEFAGLVDGKIEKIVKEKSELIGQDWGMGFFKQKSSDFTDDVFNETADMTIGDAWLKPYSDDPQGNSIIIVRNPTIDKLIREAIKENKLNMEEKDIDLIFKSQSSHYVHTHEELAYRLYKVDQKGKWRPKKRVSASNDISPNRKKTQDLREEISTASHTHYKNAFDHDDFSLFVKPMKKLSKKYRKHYLKMKAKKMTFGEIVKKSINKISK